MKSLNAFLLASMLLSTSAMACPEMDGVDLADGDNPPAITELNEVTYAPTLEEFVKIPGFSSAQYERCKDAFVIRTFKSDVSGKVYNAILSVEDSCDGGNSYGGLYDQSMNLIGDIGDSFISCY